MTFVKTGSSEEIIWEAVGLNWLAQAGGAQVVKVISAEAGRLVEERLSTVPHTSEAAEKFGQDLATTHLAGAPTFGAAPPGWPPTGCEPETAGWIGRARLPLGNYSTWGAFYADLRLMPHAENAYRLGSLSKDGLKIIEQVCDRLHAGEFDDGRPPARIHGDLWAGNVMSTKTGLVMIDPAAHGGHGETDLAMLALFGYPNLHIVTSAYAEVVGLDANWPDRVGLHQLHPLLVHAELFGSGYGAQAVQAASRYV